MKENALILVRVSTEQQDLIQQKEEVIKRVKIDGYNIKPDYIIEDKESAVLLSEEERNGLKRLKEIINKDKTVKVVYTYEISRISRKIKTIYNIRDFLQENKVQLIILNPSITVFDKNWEVNPNANLLFSLFAALAENEGFIRKERFARGKKRNAELMKYAGGKYVKFGYIVNDDGFIEIDEEKSNFVKTIFELYSSGGYSLKTLEKEIKQRGGDISWRNIQKILNDCSYYGGASPFSKLKRKYPSIISKEIFDKCKLIANGNNKSLSKESKFSYFANKILKCSECGSSFISNGLCYKCLKHREKEGCNNNISISVEYIDGLLWSIAKDLEFDMITDQNNNDISELEKQISVIEGKIKAAEKEGEKYNIKLERIKNLYKRNLSTESEFEKDLSNLNATEKNRKNEILKYNEEIRNLKKQIHIIQNPQNTVESLLSLANDIISINNEKKMNEIIHRQIKKMTVEKKNYNGKQGIYIKLLTLKGIELEFVYFSKSKSHKMYLIDKDSLLKYDDIKLIRKDGKCQLIMTK